MVMIEALNNGGQNNLYSRQNERVDSDCIPVCRYCGQGDSLSADYIQMGQRENKFSFFNLLFFKKNSLKCQGKTIRKSGSSSMNSLSGTIGSKVPGVKQPYFSGLTSPTAEI